MQPAKFAQMCRASSLLALALLLPVAIDIPGAGATDAASATAGRLAAVSDSRSAFASPTPPDGFPSQVPFYPHYPSRKTTVLDGVWEFGYAGELPDPTNVDPGTAVTDSLASVPSAFDVQLPGVEGRRGSAFYRTKFAMTANTPGAVLFAACSFYCNVLVDGVGIGDHRASGYAPFWLPIPASTSTVRELLVLADNRFNSTTAPTHTGGDFYNYGGITRNVIVHELPGETYIQRVESFVRSWKGGVVDIHAVLGGKTDLDSVEVTLKFDDGAPSHPVPVYVVDGVAAVNGVVVPDAKPWTPKSPNLHNVTVTVSFPGSAVDDSVLIRIGLRQVGKTTPTSSSPVSRITINDVPLKMFGVNRHTMWPDTGSALTEEQVQQDVALLKELNVNYIRGAHYPQDQRFLDLCDEAGILVWEETLGPGVKTSDLLNPYFMKYQVQAVNEMVSASFSHPSVIIHAFYNEGPSDNPKACPGYLTSATTIRDRVGDQKLVTYASDKKTSDVCLNVADVVSFNSYPGWYDHAGNLSEPKVFWTAEAEWMQSNRPTQPFLVSETGAGGVYEWLNATAPRWSQQYEAELVQADASTILEDVRFSGLTVWQFNDIKANTHDTQKCGQCDYVPNSNPPTCAYINVDCSRPGGENHKGQLDFWRRKKLTFTSLSKLYASVTMDSSQGDVRVQA